MVAKLLSTWMYCRTLSLDFNSAASPVRTLANSSTRIISSSKDCHWIVRANSGEEKPTVSCGVSRAFTNLLTTTSKLQVSLPWRKWILAMSFNGVVQWIFNGVCSSNSATSDINAYVSFKSVEPHGKLDAKALQPNIASAVEVIVLAAKATDITSFLPSLADHPGLIQASSV